MPQSALSQVQQQEMSTEKRRALEEQAASLKPVPRITPADLSGDLRSMKRRLDQRLYLMIKHKGQEAAGEAAAAEEQLPAGSWTFPRARNLPEETLRQTANRALTAAIGRRQPMYPLGNAPMGHLLRRRPEGAAAAARGMPLSAQRAPALHCVPASSAALLNGHSVTLQGARQAWLTGLNHPALCYRHHTRRSCRHLLSADAGGGRPLGRHAAASGPCLRLCLADQG